MQQIVILTDWNWNGSLTHKQNVAKTETNYRNKVNNYPQSNFIKTTSHPLPSELDTSHRCLSAARGERRGQGPSTKCNAE